MIREDIRTIRKAKRPPKITPFWEQMGRSENGKWVWAPESHLIQTVDPADLERAAHILSARGDA